MARCDTNHDSPCTHQDCQFIGFDKVHHAAKYGNLDRLKALVDAGHDLKLPVIYWGPYNNNRKNVVKDCYTWNNILTIAIRGGHVAVIKWILEQPGGLELLNTELTQPFMGTYAIFADRMTAEILQILIDAGADTTARNEVGRCYSRSLVDHVYYWSRADLLCVMFSNGLLDKPVRQIMHERIGSESRVDGIIECKEYLEKYDAMIEKLIAFEESSRRLAGKWRPTNASEFPNGYRGAMRALVVLAKVQYL